VSESLNLVIGSLGITLTSIVLVPKLLFAQTPQVHHHYHHASKIGNAYFNWDWGNSPSGSSTYLVVCGNPQFNYSRRMGGCANIDVFQENVSDKDSIAINDRLVIGKSYRACVAVDSHPSVHHGKGRWSSCTVFNMQRDINISFGVLSLRPTNFNH